MRRGVTLLVAIVSTVTSASHVRAQARLHAHGVAELNIAIDGRTGLLEFTATAQDVYGFEREPRTPAERVRRAQRIAALRTEFASVVLLDSQLGCTVTPVEVHAGNDSHAHDDRTGGHFHAGEDERGQLHIDVHGEYALRCAKAPAGHDIRFAITKTFPSIHTVLVRMRSDSIGSVARVERDSGVVRP